MDLDKTLYCGNISEETTEELLYELFLQAGPLKDVKIVRDKEGIRKSFAFITFYHSISVPYSIDLMNGIRLCGSALDLKFRNGSTHEKDETYISKLIQHSSLDPIAIMRLKALKYQNIFDKLFYKEYPNNNDDEKSIVKNDSHTSSSKRDSTNIKTYQNATIFHSLPSNFNHNTAVPTRSNIYNPKNNLDYFTPQSYHSYQSPYIGSHNNNGHAQPILRDSYMQHDYRGYDNNMNNPYSRNPRSQMYVAHPPLMRSSHTASSNNRNFSDPSSNRNTHYSSPRSNRNNGHHKNDAYKRRYK